MTSQWTLADVTTTEELLAAMKRESLQHDYDVARYKINAFYQPQRDKLDAQHRAALDALDAKHPEQRKG